ncbi:MAG: hypothetical protein IPK50_16140 [Fibrobacterota bacterium]|nr:hypothetical protein [Fibrobacterota bacterium]QQS03815.1 MAG: hypothetical protein IPK50_16140 [Fibrobacterota bacterium]
MQTNRHAILIVAHRFPEQVHRLAERLQHPGVDLFLHVDRRVKIRPFLHPRLIPVDRPIPIVWNGFGLVQATLSWLRANQGKGYRTFTYLSGQDYPTMEVDQIVKQFESGRDFLVDTAWSEIDRTGRWGCFHITDPNPMVRIFDRFRRRLVPSNRGIRQLPRGLEYRCGSALWTMPSRVVEWMLPFLEQRPDIEGFFRNTIHSDEVFYQTVLNSSPFADSLGDHAHYIDWSRGAPHPEVLDMNHLEHIRVGKHLFARKVEPTASAELLDLLDRRRTGAEDPRHRSST